MNEYLQLPKRMAVRAAPTTPTENLLVVQNNQQNDTNTQQVQPQNTQPQRNTQQRKIYEHKAREDSIIFADDANLINEHDMP